MNVAAALQEAPGGVNVPDPPGEMFHAQLLAPVPPATEGANENVVPGVPVAAAGVSAAVRSAATAAVEDADAE